MICFTSSLIINLYHFATDFNHLLLQLLGTDIDNSLFNTEWAIGIWHSWLKHFNGWWKAVKNLICYSCIFSVQLHVHLKKWTLKFKLLYLWNYISYCNKICNVCCVNTHIQNLKVWLKSVPSRLKYSIVSGGLFLLAHPVYAFFACSPDGGMVLFCYYFPRDDTAAPSGLYARLCHAFLVDLFGMCICGLRKISPGHAIKWCEQCCQ